MTLFFLLAASLVVVALALLLAGPLRARAVAGRDSDLRATNVALARERRTTLADAFADGAIDRESHDRELEQLERDLAAELEALPVRVARDGSVPAMLLVAVFVPIAAGALYLRLGDPGAITRDARAGRAAPDANALAAGAGTTAPALADLIPRLEERLAAEPDDIDGWRLLGRTYLGLEEFDRAATALRRALALEEDAATLGQLAEAVAMGRGGALAGEPAELLERALALDPADPQGLWLLAISRQQAGAHAEALQLFERLRTVVAQDTAAVATIDDMMARSRTELGDSARDPAGDRPVIDPAAVPGAGSGVNPTTAPPLAGSESDPMGGTVAGAGPTVDGTAPNATAGPGARVTLTVALSDAARADAQPDETVFVYARASEGPPMPLAVARYTVADLPVEVTLDESMAMLPAMSLARFPEVTVGARVSRTGEAIAASGDWFAERADVTVGEDDAIELVIDARRP